MLRNRDVSNDIRNLRMSFLRIVHGMDLQTAPIFEYHHVEGWAR